MLSFLQTVKANVHFMLYDLRVKIPMKGSFFKMTFESIVVDIIMLGSVGLIVFGVMWAKKTREDMKKRIVTQDYGRSAISLAHWIDFAGILCILIGLLFKWINYYN